MSSSSTTPTGRLCRAVIQTTIAAVAFSASVTASAQTANSTHPVPLNKGYVAGEGLSALGPWPENMQVKPIIAHKSVNWFVGRLLTSVVYEAEDGVLRFDNLPYEEHVRVLNGEAILISKDGTRNVFAKGDDFIVPLGWSGTWEIKGGYRELATFDTKSLNKALKKWFGGK